MDEKQAQLEWEARAGRPAGVSALVAAALVLGGIVYSVAALPRGANKAKDFLPDLHAHSGAFLGASIIASIGMLFTIPVLLYLYRVTRFRREALPSVARVLAVLGPLAFAVLQIIFQLKQIDAADKFVAGVVKTNKHAEDVIRDQTSLVAGVSLGARIAVGLAFIMISLNAMRAGLLSRFMGILGVILGALFVLPLVAAPLIQLFWLGALGLLFLDRWPGFSRGPAWETGEPLPWPSAAQRAAQQGRAPESAQALADPDDPEEPPEPQSQRASGARSRKRKRKRAGR